MFGYRMAGAKASMKKLVLGAVGVVVLAAAVYAWKTSGARSEAEAAEVTFAKVERSTIESTVSTTGRVIPNLEVDIKCKASGKVITLPFEVSDSVKEGDLLVELDPVDEQRAVRQSEVALQASQARLNQAKQQLDVAERNLITERRRAEANLTALEKRAKEAAADVERAKTLQKQGYISPQELDQATTALVQAQADLETGRTRIQDLKTQETALEVQRQDVKLAETQVELDRLRLQDARQRLEDTKVVAPIDGVVATRLVQTGMIISSGISNVGGGTTMMTLADLSRVFVLASVDESDIGRVREGQKAEITVDAFPTQRFSGEVVRIATKGVNAYNVVTFEVKIEVKDEKMDMLKPEMTANVEILLDSRDNVLTLPVEAVTRKDGKHYATVVRANGATEERAVELGITDGLKYEVTAGLEEGETVQVRSNDVGDSKWRGKTEKTEESA